MFNQDQKELIQAYGWEDLGPQKNAYMLSFKKENLRMNIYFTTMTITIQDIGEGHCAVYKRVSDIEDVLAKH